MLEACIHVRRISARLWRALSALSSRMKNVLAVCRTWLLLATELLDIAQHGLAHRLPECTRVMSCGRRWAEGARTCRSFAWFRWTRKMVAPATVITAKRAMKPPRGRAGPCAMDRGRANTGLTEHTTHGERGLRRVSQRWGVHKVPYASYRFTISSHSTVLSLGKRRFHEASLFPIPNGNWRSSQPVFSRKTAKISLRAPPALRRRCFPRRTPASQPFSNIRLENGPKPALISKIRPLGVRLPCLASLVASN